MSSKQIIFAFLISILLTIGMIGGAWMYYQQDKSFFGLLEVTDEKSKYYDLDPDKSFVVTGSELIELKSNTDRMYTLEKDYNILKEKYESIKSEYDQLMGESGNGQKKDSISSQLTTLAKKEQILKDSLKLLDRELKTLKENYKSSEEKVADLVNKMNGGSDSLNMEKYKDFAKIYNNSKPQEVANILTNLDAKKSAYILKLMSKKKAGKVIESLNSEYAAKVLIESSKLR